MKYLLSLGLMLSIICFAFTYKTERTITGKITDDKGQPIPFATIAIKGTKISVASDAVGEFSIKVPNDDAVLIVSAINYQPSEIKITGLTKVEIKLTPTTSNLSEVVVTTALGI